MTEKNERIYIGLVIAAVAVVLIIVLVMIWMPDSKVIKNNLNVVQSTQNYEELQKNYYSKELRKMLNSSNYTELYEKVDKEWLSTNDYNKESLYDMLVNQGIIKNGQPQINSIVSVPFGEKYYYRVEVLANTNVGIKESRYVVINENTPGNYSITFEQEQISGLQGKKYSAQYEDLAMECEITSVMTNIIQYEITVRNIGERFYYISLSTNDSITLDMQNGNHYSASDYTSLANKYFNIGPEGYLTFKVAFNVQIENQNDIKSITFTNAADENHSVDLVFEFKEGE